MKNLKSTLLFALLLQTSTLALEFNDTLFEKQWGIKNQGQILHRRSGDLTREEVVGLKGKDINWVDIKEIHPQIPNDREIIVAVLDSGVDLGHPDLQGRIYFDNKLCPNDEDRNTKPCQGINVLKRNNELADDTGHGTHVAGIIAAQAGNGLGVAGITDPRVKIMPIKVISKDTNDFIYDGKLMTDIFADGIVFAISRGAKVINISMGWPKVIETPKIKRALELAAKNNVIIVAAAGNNNKQIPLYPCTNETVICVGAVDNQGKITEFTNFGGKVDILAPGEFIVSTYPRETVESRILRIRGYEAIKGSSQASPFVAAIAASLKLLDPEMSLDEVKARLYSSARNSQESYQFGKFSKYGLVDMRKALEEAPARFITPIFKNLLDLNFKSSDGSFFFGLPIKSLKGDFEKLTVETKFNREDISLESEIHEVSLKQGQDRAILVKGKLNDLKADTHFRLYVKIKEGEKVLSETQTTLIFARDLSRENEVVKEVVEEFKASELTFFRGPRKALRVRKIEDPERLRNAPEFFVQTTAKQTDEETILDILSRSEERKWTKETIKFERKHEVVTLAHRDLDLDGSTDLYVVAVNKDQNRITFDYFLRNMSGETKEKISFNFPLLEYPNFPLEYGDLGKTPMRTIRYLHGRKIKVPTFYAPYTLPEADNSQDILDRVPSEVVSNHLYYFEPHRKGAELQFRLRVVDSLSALEEFKEFHMVESWQPVSMDRPFVASTKDQRQGSLRGIISVGEDFMRQYYLYKVTDAGLEYQQVFFMNHLVAGNSIRPLMSTNSKSLGEIVEKVEFVAQLQRSQARSYVWDLNSKEGSSLVLDTKNWGDPIFNTISSFDDSENSRFIETRYFLEFYTNEGIKEGLRINRESSFPGVRFSETLAPLAVKGEEENYPGIFINSTLIFGNRLYTMVKKGKDFLRPLELSIDIPENCVHMNPEKIDGIYQYLMICRESDDRATILRVPLEI